MYYIFILDKKVFVSILRVWLFLTFKRRTDTDIPGRNKEGGVLPFKEKSVTVRSVKVTIQQLV